MELKIQSIHFDATEKLNAFIEKKAAKLEKTCENIIKAEFILKVVKPELRRTRKLHFTLHFPVPNFMQRRCVTLLKKVLTSVLILCFVKSKNIRNVKPSNLRFERFHPLNDGYNLE